MRFFISIFFLSLTFNICVLTAQSIREQADKAFSNKNYHQASNLYDQWVKALPNDYNSHIQLAISYIHIKNNHKAALTLCTAINAGLQEDFLVQDTLFTPLFIHFDTLFIHQLQLPVHNGMTIQDLVIQKIKEQSKASTFPLKFTEQKRIGRYRVLYPTEYDSTLQYNLCLVLHGNSQNPEFILQWVQSLHIKNTLFITCVAFLIAISALFKFDMDTKQVYLNWFVFACVQIVLITIIAISALIAYYIKIHPIKKDYL